MKLIVPRAPGDQANLNPLQMYQYTNRVHTFGKEWDLLAPGYESVQFDSWSWIWRGLQAWIG